MQPEENREFTLADLSDLEGRLKNRGRKEEEKRQPQTQPQQQQTPKEGYLAEVASEDQELAKKLREAERLHGSKTAETKGNVVSLEEMLKGRLGGKKFSALYSLCPLGSKKEHPAGYHVVYTGNGKAPIDPQIIPADLAAEALGQVMNVCYYHAIGTITGAIKNNKPYEVLPFSPCQELQQLIFKEYNLATRQSLRRNYSIKAEEDIVSAVIFEDSEFYADPLKRKEVVDYLQKADSAIRLYKEGKLSQEDTYAIVKNRPKAGKPIVESLPIREAAKEAIQPNPEEKATATQAEIVYGIPFKPQRSGDLEYINLIIRAFKQPYEVIQTAESGTIGVRFQNDEDSNNLPEIMDQIKRLDAIISILRGSRKTITSEGIKAQMPSLYNIFGQQPQ